MARFLAPCHPAAHSGRFSFPPPRSCLLNSPHHTSPGNEPDSLFFLYLSSKDTPLTTTQIKTGATVDSGLLFDKRLRCITMSTARHEERPLLGPKGDSHEQKLRRRVVVVSFTLVLLNDFAGFFLDAPQTSILEGNICSRYYQSTPSPAGRDCTAGPVQAELAIVNQMLNTFNRLPGLFAAIPFGIIADRYGRRPVFVLTILGALLQDVISKIILWRPDVFAPRLIWLSSLATFVGGGDAVATSMVFLVVADVAQPHQRAELFFLLTACERVGEIVGTPLSALLMSIWNPWIPYLMYSILTLLAGMVPVLFLPETLRRSRPPPDTGIEPDTPLCESNSRADEGLPASANGTPSTPTHSTIISKFRPLIKHNVVAVLLAFFVSALGRQSTGFLLQYTRQRFNWTYEKVLTDIGHPYPLNTGQIY